MNKAYTYEITRKVLEEVYPEQLAIFEDWRKQRTRAEERGESGTAHTIVPAIPDFVFSIVSAVPLDLAMSATLGVLTGTIANIITDRFGSKNPPPPPPSNPPSPPPRSLDDETISKLAMAIATALKSSPPEAPS